MWVDQAHLDLGAIVEELGIFHTRAKPGKVKMAEGPAKDVKIETIAILREAAIVRRCEVA
jgi:hypothetical protein